MKYTILSVFLLTAPMVLTGCNTMEGAGEDMEEAGEELEEEAS